MFDGDLFCRSVVYPKGFTEHVFFDEALIDLRDWSKDKSRQKYEVSVASSFLLRTEERAHEYGCSVAKAALTRMINGTNGNVEEANTPHYLGYYEFHAGALKKFSMQYYDMELKWAPENGNNEHFSLAMVLRAQLPSKNAHKDDLKMARNRIAKALMGPKRKVCDCDAEIAGRLSAIELPVVEYRDFE